MIATHFRRHLVAVLFLFATTQSHGATITFSSPADNQNYAANAAIPYGGSGTWDPRGSGDIDTDTVITELVWWPQNNVTGPGTLMDSDESIVIVDPNGGFSYSFSNETFTSGPQQGESTMRATKHNQDAATYMLRATPYYKNTRPYIVQGSNGNTTVRVFKPLGTIN